MDALRPGHTHRSSSDRLLNNYLYVHAAPPPPLTNAKNGPLTQPSYSDSQKSLTTSLLTLLSHSHASTSSLLAYVTSSPGVLLPVRRAVRHAAFEGPLSPSMHESAAGTNGSALADTGTPGWASYVSSLEDFRKDLKQIHLLEEEMSRVKRDREILVTRLIKTTKSRPTKSDIKDMANSLSVPRDREGSIMSSQASVYSHSSDVSATTNNKESKRAGKLAEAQAELLGCEEHLRSLEVRIESERNKVMYRGLEERFRAMEVVGHMWLAQSRRGLEDLEKLPDLPANAYELDSNGSLAPSQSASQVGYEDASPIKRAIRMSGPRGPGSIEGDIAEEEEGGGSSDDEPHGALVMHENRQGGLVMHENRRASGQLNGSATGPATAPPHKPSPLGQQPAGAPAPYLPTAPYSSIDRSASAARRATSEIGTRAYNPPQRQPLRRTVSNDHSPPRRAGSDTSSIRSVRKKGFFASIARFFKGPKHKPNPQRSRSGRDSPARAGGAWQTRTNDNLKRGSTIGRTRMRSDSSSDEDDMANLVQVSNRGPTDFGGWSAADVGRVPSTSGRATVVPRATTPKATAAAGGVTRSNTVKSTKSVNTVRSSATDTAKTRKNGSIARTKSAKSRADARSSNIMSIVDMAPPAMPDVPKAPSSQNNPRMELVTAPGSSIVPSGGKTQLVLPSHVMTGAVSRVRDQDELRPQDSISRSNSARTAKSERVPKADKQRDLPERPRSVSPLPPSKMRSPPLKSALRPTSPSPPGSSLPPPVITTLFSVSAPPPVDIPSESEPEHEIERQPSPSPAARPAMAQRNSSYSGTGDETSLYESAREEGGAAVTGDDDETSDDEATELGRYNVVENERVARRNEIAASAEGRDLPPLPGTTSRTLPPSAHPLSPFSPMWPMRPRP
ncbi:uncharacterized protein EHS24_004702 [Apiotrichum porosum]|uniref:Uncharacterized protein n=1 Tax=Apiotrichum porosum TaxID=105984 RepID=A0A427Y5U5_9TREE|nr:uncharacterized protein EHS24_004702 [Apiotrichum porosum]RSH86446.1 hypothetical protein EHS24_004702 [Apiotrichum porosum]